jgi:hypothetical protein
LAPGAMPSSFLAVRKPRPARSAIRLRPWRLHRQRRPVRASGRE